MAERVVLHVGTMKSGTTYLQDVLTSGALDDAGAFYAGGTFGVQTKAVRNLLRPEAQRKRGPWRSLAAEARATSGVAVVSQEFLSFAGRPRVAEVVGSFGDVPVDVVLTVRDQHGAIPAQWQSFTRNRGADDFATYVARLRRGARRRTGANPSKAVRSFRRAQNVAGIVDRWSTEGVRSVTVVVVPPPGSPTAELWHRFCRAADLPATDVGQAGRRSNESLGYASCEALRLVNAHVGALDQARYKRARTAVIDALLPLRPDEGRPGLDRAGAELACALNADLHRVLAREDVRLVGSPEELPTDVASGLPEVVAPPEPAQVRRATTAAWSATWPDRDAVGAPEDPRAAAAEVARELVARFG